MNQIKKAIKNLSPDLTEKYLKALDQGYKNKICPKCKTVFLAHHHFIRCDLAHNNKCPMVVKDSKSLAQKLLDEKDL
jgi:ribosomal protein S27AE